MTRRTKISGPFVPHSQLLIESMAWRGMSSIERRVLERVEAEHLRHAGKENGNLVVTFDDFNKSGIRRQSVAGAIRGLERRGLVRGVRSGRDLENGKRLPTRYRLTFLPSVEGPPTNEWERFTAQVKIQKPRCKSAPTTGAKVHLGKNFKPSVPANSLGAKAHPKAGCENAPSFYIYGDSPRLSFSEWVALEGWLQ